MFLLALDFGNTTLKVALFEKETLLEVRYDLSKQEIENWIEQIQATTFGNLEGIMISSVRKKEELESYFGEELEKILKFSPNSKKIATETKPIAVLILDENTKLPIQNQYKTPKTLGKDRLAAVIGAYFLEKQTPKQPTLVIDAGTCITFDFIDTEIDTEIYTIKNTTTINQNQSLGIYKGGSISLGLQMRFKALNHFTAKLPLVETNPELPSPIGTSTQEAIQSGVQFGLMAEIKGIIDFYQHQINLTNKENKTAKKLNVVLCGGDASILEKWWRHYQEYQAAQNYQENLDKYLTTFAFPSHSYPKWTIEPNLVLMGLQRIFQFIQTHEDN